MSTMTDFDFFQYCHLYAFLNRRRKVSTHNCLHKRKMLLRLKLDKPEVKYADHYLCRAERIEEGKYPTEIAPA